MERQDLNYFKEKLEQKKVQLIQAVQKSESYGREADSEAEAMDLVDMASKAYTKEFMFSRSDTDRQLLQMVEEALERIRDGSYGECQHCGDRVERKRLEAVPWARLCLKCQQLAEEGAL